MKALRVLIHLLVSLTAAFAVVGIPALVLLPLPGANGTDAVSSASIQLPEKPSGEFVVLLNRSLHEDSLAEWTAFFRDGELNVIFDDIQCIVASADTAALQMAERFQAQLPENQMRLRTEDATLLVSKADNHCIDAAVFSKEMADSLRLRPDGEGTLLFITIKDGAAP